MYRLWIISVSPADKYTAIYPLKDTPILRQNLYNIPLAHFTASLYFFSIYKTIDSCSCDFQFVSICVHKCSKLFS